jgi:HSP20 family protein
MFELVTWPRNPWSIFDEFESLQDDMNRMLTGREKGQRSEGWRRKPAYPLMNIWAAEEGLLIDVELPGVDPKDVDVSVVGDELTLQGKVNAVAAAEGETHHRRERPSGTFSRTLQLPFRANADGVKAVYTNGVLRLTVPRSEEEKPRKIAIEA